MKFDDLGKAVATAAAIAGNTAEQATNNTQDFEFSDDLRAAATEHLAQDMPSMAIPATTAQIHQFITTEREGLSSGTGPDKEQIIREYKDLKRVRVESPTEIEMRIVAADDSNGRFVGTREGTNLAHHNQRGISTLRITSLAPDAELSLPEGVLLEVHGKGGNVTGDLPKDAYGTIRVYPNGNIKLSGDFKNTVLSVQVVRGGEKPEITVSGLEQQREGNYSVYTPHEKTDQEMRTMKKLHIVSNGGSVTVIQRENEQQ